MFEFFQKHPRAVGETYLEHFTVAASFGAAMILGGIACLIHAVFPAWFEFTASRVISKLYIRMVTHRRRKPSPFELDYAI